MMIVEHGKRDELIGLNGSRGGLLRDYSIERVDSRNNLEILRISGNVNRIVQSEETMTFGWMFLVSLPR